MSLPDPVTRKEMYLNKAATGSGSVPPKPVTREEMYLAEIANGGGSGGGGASSPLVLTLVPTNPSNPFQGGTYTGATPEEVVAARRSGRAIRASLGGRAFDVTCESESDLIGQFLYQIASTIFFVQVAISKVDTVYTAHGFTGLQVQD